MTFNWTVVIIGDGLDAASTVLAENIAASDPRISFFSFEKDSSRGERFRHQLLSERAEGEIVCYLCDRDLYLPNHVEVMYELLQSCDFGHSLWSRTEADGTVNAVTGILNYQDLEQRQAQVENNHGIGLSLVAHRLDAYKKLPYGWRVTPKGLYTDVYMWRQFLAENWVRTGIAYESTIVYIKRGEVHPGLSTSERVKESRRFFDLYCVPGGAHAHQCAVNRYIHEKEAARYMRRLRKQKNGP